MENTTWEENCKKAKEIGQSNAGTVGDISDSGWYGAGEYRYFAEAMAAFAVNVSDTANEYKVSGGVAMRAFMKEALQYDQGDGNEDRYASTRTNEYEEGRE